MGRGLLTGPSAAVAGLVLAGPRLLARGAAPAAGVAAGAVAGTARAGVRSADAAVRVGRVARNALPGGDRHWRSGRRAHLALRPTAPECVRRHGGTAQAARKVAVALAEHPEVAYAYWDGGLARLVVAAREEAVTDQVLEKATALAERHGLGPGDDDVEDFVHPGDPEGIRTAAAALLADVAGTGAALTAYALRLPPSPRFVTAGVTLLRENPRFRRWLRDRVGRSRTDLLLAVANAATHGAGQTPTSLLLDGTLRTFQLAETLARAAAFDTLHDRLCDPDRPDVAPDLCERPPLRSTPAHEYANHAETGSMVGAAATLLVKHSAGEAAEAVLAGSPKAARYGPAAFNAVLGCALARSGVLVRDAERVRRLETARTLVLHPSALCTDEEESADAWTEAVLDAARHAGLRVVVVDHPALEDFTALADRVVRDRPLRDVVESLREHGCVITVARPESADDTDVLTGLLGSDLAVALADGDDSPVVWAADLVATGGLADVWRLLTAVPAARKIGRRSQTLARSGAALSGLMVAVGESRRGRPSPVPGLRHAPVDIGAAVALFSGARAALGVASTPAPHPRARVAWHALRPSDVRARLRRRTEGEPSVVEQATGRVRRAADAAG
ncbi:cation-translocating P-type ATPase, partial [Streptomyces sp. NPDC003635]